MKIAGLLLTVTYTAVTGQSDLGSATASCVTPDGLQGSCIPYLLCTSYSTYLEGMLNDTSKAEFLRERICKVDGPNIYLCCAEVSSSSSSSSSSSQGQPPTTISRVIPNEEECGIPSQVLGDQPGAWPWLALVGVLDEGKLYFPCHGTLITTRHVLTVAHCLRSDLYLIRLGEYNTEHNLAGERPLDYGILKSVQYPGYDLNDGNDIGIITMDGDVAYTQSIRPICLPFPYRNDDLTGRRLILVGYGSTDPDLPRNSTSKIPVTAETVVVSLEECRKAYSVSVTGPWLCTGDGMVYACFGDSGAGLTIYNPVKNRFYLVGIVSFGSLECGDTAEPDVNTQISRFLDWIEQEVS